MKKIALNKWFTLIELIIATIILSIGLIGVFVTMKNSYKFLQEIKEKTMAINFARGGMEWVFSIRDTNWQRWSGKKDKCWLKVNPLFDDDWKCENDAWFSSWSYVLALATWNSDQEYFFLSKQDEAFNPDGPLIESDWKYLLCEDTNNWIIKACTWYTSRPTNYFDPTLFFRQVRGWYLLDKNANTNITSNCSEGDDAWCWDGRFLEKNFCVDVFYFDGVKKKITMCSVMTNFMK